MKIITVKSMLIKKLLNKQFSRFLLAGFINAIISYIIYYLCLMFMNYIYSYYLSLFISVLLCAYLNVKFVFKINVRRITFIPFFVIFSFQALIGGRLLKFWVESLSISEIIAPLLNIIFITPIVFSLNSSISKYFKKF